MEIDKNATLPMQTNPNAEATLNSLIVNRPIIERVIIINQGGNLAQ